MLHPMVGVSAPSCQVTDFSSGFRLSKVFAAHSRLRKDFSSASCLQTDFCNVFCPWTAFSTAYRMRQDLPAGSRLRKDFSAASCLQTDFCYVSCLCTAFSAGSRLRKDFAIVSRQRKGLAVASRQRKGLAVASHQRKGLAVASHLGKDFAANFCVWKRFVAVSRLRKYFPPDSLCHPWLSLEHKIRTRCRHFCLQINTSDWLYKQYKYSGPPIRAIINTRKFSSAGNSRKFPSTRSCNLQLLDLCLCVCCHPACQSSANPHATIFALQLMWVQEVLTHILIHINGQRERGYSNQCNKRTAASKMAVAP